MSNSHSENLLAAGRSTAGTSLDILRRQHDDPITRAARGSLADEASRIAEASALATRAMDAVSAPHIRNAIETATAAIGRHQGIDRLASSAQAAQARITDAVSAGFIKPGTLAGQAAEVAGRAAFAPDLAAEVKSTAFDQAVKAATASFGNPGFPATSAVTRALRENERVHSNLLCDHLPATAFERLLPSSLVDEARGRLAGYVARDPALGSYLTTGKLRTGYESQLREVLDGMAGRPARAHGDDLAPRRGRALAQTEPPTPSRSLSAPIGEHVMSVADIGRRVREARKAMDMTQQRFADLAGVGRRFLIELEQGKPSLEIGKVLTVCRAAGIRLGFIA